MAIEEVDIDLLIQQLRRRGHEVGTWRFLPGNAGEYEVQVDGNLLTLIEARELLAADEHVEL